MNGGFSSARSTAWRGCPVRDWTQLVRERLGALGLAPQLKEEVVAELAAHLDDRFADGVRSGMSESEAVAMALEEVPDWVVLNQEISAAKEGPMNERTRSLWLPGMTMLISAFILMSAFARLVGDEDDVVRLRGALTDSSTAMFIFMAWLVMYGVFGALGAHWSRRAGGSARTRFLAGIFPVALHVVIFVAVFTATSLQVSPRTPEWLVPSFLLRVFLTFILLPGIALGVGALPFLRDGSLRGPMVAARDR